ncbi:hypothetical protein L249_7612, partial [Ophiocordyceps polyrhachis-furcata BCC 54312]
MARLRRLLRSYSLVEKGSEGERTDVFGSNGSSNASQTTAAMLQIVPVDYHRHHTYSTTPTAVTAFELAGSRSSVAALSSLEQTSLPSTSIAVLTTALTMVMPTFRPSETESSFSLVSFISRAPSSLRIPSYPVPEMMMTTPPSTASSSSSPSSSSSSSSSSSFSSSSSSSSPPTSEPKPTPTLTPSSQPQQPYAQNIVLATQLNSIYSILTPSQPCHPNQEACVDGKIARCSNGSFKLEACRQKEEKCWAWPLSSTVGVYVTCRTSLDALKVLGKEALPKKAVRPVVTLTTVVTAFDSYQTSRETSSSPKPGFISVTGPIAGPTPTITTPYLLSTYAPPPREEATYPANPAPKQPPALMVLPVDGYSAKQKDAAPPHKDEAYYSTVTVTETKVPDTVTVTVTLSIKTQITGRLRFPASKNRLRKYP